VTRLLAESSSFCDTL